MELMAFKKFEHDDNEYFKWMDRNPSAFIVNTTKSNNTKYFVLHRSKCRQISPTARRDEGAYTKGTYIKVASDDIAVLRSWFESNYSKFKGQFTECKTCNPLSNRL